MKPYDIISLSLNNLTQNKFRTFLAILGVTIGIGSLSSMISIGQGITNNITNTLISNDIFTGLNVSTKDDDYSKYGNLGNYLYSEESLPINDSIVSVIEQIPQVTTVFPEIIKFAEISFNGKSIKSNVKSVPAIMGKFKPFSNMAHGHFYKSDKENSVVLSKAALYKFGYIIEGDNDFGKSKNIKVLPADSIIGKDIHIITKIFDYNKYNPNSASNAEIPIIHDTTTLTITGIVQQSPLSAGLLSVGIFLPSNTCENLHAIDLKDVFNIINDKPVNYENYKSLYVKVLNYKDLKIVKSKIEDMGFVVFSVGDKLEDIEKIFNIIDILLAAIGTIAILVSIFGIINTMLMSIYERRKEIGIMKAIGATKRQIKLIFYIESSIIGFIGGIFGVLFGCVASGGASAIAGEQIGNLLTPGSNFFDFNWKLAVASIIFATIITIIASIYPSRKAAKIDPLIALRRE
ncbi:MAG: ABC transporter permease [Bacteroidales bacterium]|nr:ABC transporter permease [Bacteroidales bacterium]